jgi:hypothetical protein
MPVTILVHSQLDYVQREASASSGRRPPGDLTLVPGELDRARAWGSSRRDALAARKAA